MQRTHGGGEEGRERQEGERGGNREEGTERRRDSDGEIEVGRGEEGRGERGRRRGER